MKMCEDCIFFIANDVSEDKGICEITKMTCDFRDNVCKHFVDIVEGDGK